MFITSQRYHSLLSRLKLLSGIKLNIKNKPQPGRFTIQVEKRNDIEVRSSTLPTNEGESIVMRILDPQSLKELESLGLREKLLENFKTQIKKPNGMILLTGPTGSGKTTTLYAFLRKIQKPGIKIITIEDPPEYQLEGITQTKVDRDRGYDFASGLKSIMRQDPDVILVGEIRDAETCKIAIQAALTGHLVFSTLHTNDAPGTISRLVSLQAKAINIGPALNLTVAQRLVRKLCPKCKKKRKLTKEESEKIKKELKNLPENVKIPEIKEVYEAKGCKYCNNTGYKDRVGVFESLLVDDEIERFILNNPSLADLRKRAVEKGMVKLKQDGLIKVLQGITSIEELERVIGE
jgi:type IV pilus assembly protein PilB